MENRKSVPSWIPVVAAAAIVLAVVQGLFWGGGESVGNLPCSPGERMRMYLDNRIGQALDGVLSTRRIYWIGRGAAAAPKPNPLGFREILSEEVPALAEEAKDLLDGQEVYFPTDAVLMPGTKVRAYLDETIFALTWKQVLDGGIYTFSEVKIAHPSQFRRFLAGGEFGSDKLYVTTDMAKSVNAVVASSGDFYGYRQAGTLVYDGTVRRINNGLVDTCYIDRQGDLHFTGRYDDLSNAQAQHYVEENDILFSLAFGPVLIRDGEVVTPSGYAVGEINDHYPRSALCQLGKLHYLLAVVNGEGNYPGVPTIHRFAHNLRDSGVQTAYALDGGQTAVIAMDGQLINAVLFGYQRKISDIIYFATAIPDRR